MTEIETRNAKALILAAGLGTRLRPVTDRIPKCLVPIRRKPLLEYWFDALLDTQIAEVLINTHHLREQVQDFIGRFDRGGKFRIREMYEPTLLGSAGTIRAARSWVDDNSDCLIIYADNLSQIDLPAFLDFHRSHTDPFSIALFHTPTPRTCGIAEMSANGLVTKFEEKPQHPGSDLANAGVYVVSAGAFREIADMNAFDIGRDVLPKFVGRMRGWTMSDYHRDIGTTESLDLAEAESAKWSQEIAQSPGSRHEAGRVLGP